MSQNRSCSNIPRDCHHKRERQQHRRNTISVSETFWDFANRVYRIPLTRDTLLFLQDDHRLDTNLLLFCCWHAHTRGRLDAATVLEALAISEPWATHVVGPLRAARTWMKLNLSVPNRTTIRQTDMAFRQQQLREQIKAVELQAEHLQEDLLESLLYGSGQGLSNTQPTLEKQMMDAMSNLESVLEASAVPLNDEINGLLAVLIGATLKTCGGPPSV